MWFRVSACPSGNWHWEGFLNPSATDHQLHWTLWWIWTRLTPGWCMVFVFFFLRHTTHIHTHTQGKKTKQKMAETHCTEQKMILSLLWNVYTGFVLFEKKCIFKFYCCNGSSGTGVGSGARVTHPAEFHHQGCAGSDSPAFFCWEIQTRKDMWWNNTRKRGGQDKRAESKKPTGDTSYRTVCNGWFMFEKKHANFPKYLHLLSKQINLLNRCTSVSLFQAPASVAQQNNADAVSRLIH